MPESKKIDVDDLIEDAGDDLTVEVFEVSDDQEKPLDKIKVKVKIDSNDENTLETDENGILRIDRPENEVILSLAESSEKDDDGDEDKEDADNDGDDDKDNDDDKDGDEDSPDEADKASDDDKDEASDDDKEGGS